MKRFVTPSSLPGDGRCLGARAARRKEARSADVVAMIADLSLPFADLPVSGPRGNCGGALGAAPPLRCQRVRARIGEAFGVRRGSAAFGGAHGQGCVAGFSDFRAESGAVAPRSKTLRGWRTRARIGEAFGVRRDSAAFGGAHGQGCVASFNDFRAESGALAPRSKAAFRPHQRNAKRFGVRRDSAALCKRQTPTPICGILSHPPPGWESRK